MTKIIDCPHFYFNCHSLRPLVFHKTYVTLTRWLNLENQGKIETYLATLISENSILISQGDKPIVMFTPRPFGAPPKNSRIVDTVLLEKDELANFASIFNTSHAVKPLPGELIRKVFPVQPTPFVKSVYSFTITTAALELLREGQLSIIKGGETEYDADIRKSLLALTFNPDIVQFTICSGVEGTLISAQGVGEVPSMCTRLSYLSSDKEVLKHLTRLTEGRYYLTPTCLVVETGTWEFKPLGVKPKVTESPLEERYAEIATVVSKALSQVMDTDVDTYSMMVESRCAGLLKLLQKEGYMKEEKTETRDSSKSLMHEHVAKLSPASSKTVTGVLRDTITDTDKIVALENCFYTWDGNIDINVIGGGVFDRYRAMGASLDNELTILRKDLHTVVIEHDNKTLFQFNRNPILTDFVRNPNYFFPEELEVMKTWLLDNYYSRPTTDEE